jgi:hypothetical protein
MAEQQVQTAPVLINVYVNDRDQSKVPLFHANPTQDSFQDEYWIQRLQRLQTGFGWTNEQTIVNAINSLQGDATTSKWTLVKQELLALIFYLIQI